jgi:hypothetical protein
MWFQSRLVQNDSTVVLFKTAASQLISLVIYSSIAGSSSWQWCSTGGNLGKIAESVGHSIQTFRVFVALVPSASGFFQHATWPCLPLELPFGFLRFRRCPHTRRYGCNRSIELELHFCSASVCNTVLQPRFSTRAGVNEQLDTGWCPAQLDNCSKLKWPCVHTGIRISPCRNPVQR